MCLKVWIVSDVSNQILLMFGKMARYTAWCHTGAHQMASIVKSGSLKQSLKRPAQCFDSFVYLSAPSRNFMYL